MEHGGCCEAGRAGRGAINISEANHLNRLLRYLDPVPLPALASMPRPTEREAIEALTYLLTRSHKALFAGYHEGEAARLVGSLRSALNIRSDFDPEEADVPSGRQHRYAWPPVLIDYNYVRGILTAFLEWDGSTMNIDDLQVTAGVELDEKFAFHMEQLHDAGVIAQAGGRPGIGLVRGSHGAVQWGTVPLRITNVGYDFAVSLEKNAILEAAKEQLAGAPVHIAIEIVKALAMKLAFGG